MTRPLITTAAIALLAFGAAPATAASCSADVARQGRLVVKLTRQVTADHALSKATRAALLRRLQHAGDGVGAIANRLTHERGAAATADCHRALTRYRVKQVLATQVRDVLSVSLQGLSAASLVTLAGVYQSRIDDARSRGRNAAAAQADVDRLRAQANGVESQALVIIASALKIDPSRYPRNRSAVLALGGAVAANAASLRTAQATSNAALAAVNALGP